MTNPETNSILSLGELISLTMEAYNRETLSNNAVVDEADTLEAENTVVKLENHELKEIVEKLQAEISDLSAHALRVANYTETVQKQAKDHMVMLEQANREKSQMQDKLTKAEMAITAWKTVASSPKKARETLKGYKDKSAKSVIAQISLRKEIGIYHKEADITAAANKALHLSLAQANITTVWSHEGDHLMLFPAPLTMAVNGKPEKQLTLLFMNQSGCGKLIGIDEDGEPLLCKIPAGGLKPKAATMQKAGGILRKFKSKNWEVTHQDLLSIKEKN